MKTNQAFDVKHIFFSTIPPYDDKKRQNNRLFKFKVITPSGNTANFLFDIFDKSTIDCKVEIVFKSDDNQYNEIRKSILDFTSTKDIMKKQEAFLTLTRKMHRITDERNGMGLFVLIEGKKGTQTRVMLCRFKGAQGLHNEGNDLKYLSQVFTKQNKHYKLAVFEDVVSRNSFWKGYAIDRQNSANNYKPFSYFWIEQFLQAETAITDAQGTSQFSKIVKNVLNATKDISEKEQIISAVVNLRSKQNEKISIKSFTERYLSGNLPHEFVAKTNNDEFFHSEFGIDSEVFNKELGNTVLVLEDGITAFVPTFSYKKHVTEENKGKGNKKIKIEGLLKDKRINVRKDQL